MSTQGIEHIADLCREIDEVAEGVYSRLSEGCEPGSELAGFWAEMAADESHHVEFWRRIDQAGIRIDASLVFDDPDRVAAELERALERSRELLESAAGEPSTAEGFVMAYRMEFYLLHPAFELLFRLLAPTVDWPSPADEYESHISHFIEKLVSVEAATPELELLAETIDSLWRENKRLSLDATRDALTGVMTRGGFFALSTQFAHLAARTGTTMGVMMIDLDSFKVVNDKHGHATGDAVLAEVGHALAGRLRTSDLVGRYGGEEFVVLATSIEAGGTVVLAEEIREEIEGLSPLGLRQTASIGVAEGTIGVHPERELHELIRAADVALYAAKASGRNAVKSAASQK